MFFTYLGRELRRRLRQAVFIALGLALGIGLVITVTAAAAGVKNARGTVLKALYGVGTDVTVTKTPTAGSFTPGSFGFGFQAGTTKRPAAGTKINTSTLGGTATLASISASSVNTVTGLHDVAAAAGGLQNKLKVGSTIAIGNSSGTATNFKVVGIVSEPAGDNPSDVYIPLAVAQKLANMKNDVNTIYVAASNSSAIGVALGLAGAELVTKLSPKLTAVVGQTTGSATPGGARQFGFGGGGGGTGGGGFPGAGEGGGGGGGGGSPFAAFRNANTAAHTVAVHLAASVSTSVIVLAVLLAVAGGIIAGMFGGWRAASQRPADALSKVA